jgi:precorrin-2 dehydrogenase/sirohydrochlorin ferrochelatase
LSYYPAYLDLRGRLVLLVGGGRVAARKLASLVAAGARVRLVAPELAADTAAQLPHPMVDQRSRGFAPEDLEAAWLAVCATDDEAVNRAVAKAAEERRVFVNVVDVPPLCSFIVPASLSRGELMLAVSTGGASPAMARRLRERLEAEFGPEWGPFLRLMRALRQRVAALGRPAEENRPLFFALADSDLIARVAAADAAGVDALVAGVLGPGYSLAELGWRPADLEPTSEEAS